ncbi:MAG: hypothetical protein Q8936_02700 [Bacillota bacterium]|nr:hypothetical protein [Bacillota bacterium]
MEPYSIPYYQRSGFKWYYNILYSFCIPFCFAGAIFFITVVSKDDFSMSVFFALFSAALGVLFSYMFVGVSILKKCYVKMTEDYIETFNMFKKRRIYWNEIYDINMYKQNNNLTLAILLKKDRAKKMKRTVNNNFNSIYGLSIYKFNMNFLAIPIFTSQIIISAFNKYYFNEFSGIGVRLFLAILCFLQVPAGIIVGMIFEEQISFTIQNILLNASSYFQYLKHHPSSQVLTIITGIFCFGMGAFDGIIKSNKNI